MRHVAPVQAAALSLLLAGAVAAPAVAAVERGSTASGAAGPVVVGDVFERTELYFGSEKPGPDVSDRDFRRFLDRTLTPQFPEGLTQLTGLGQFRGSDGEIVRERSFVVVLLYPLDDTGASARIEAVRDAYEQQFQQESVLRVDSRDRVSF